MEIQGKLFRMALCYLHSLTIIMTLAYLLQRENIGFMLSFTVQSFILYWLIKKD